MIRRLIVLVLVVALLVVLVVLGGGRGALSFVFGWLVVGYLLFRAWPGVRSDLARLPLRRRRSRGGVL
jgi:hypothetical protein